MEECIRQDETQRHRWEAVIAQQMAKADMEIERQSKGGITHDDLEQTSKSDVRGGLVVGGGDGENL